MYHIFSKLFDSQDLWPHLTWSYLFSFLSKVVRLLVCVFMVKISLNVNKICFMPYSTTLSINKTDPPPPEKKPRAVKDRGGGVKGRYDYGQRFNGFFLGFPYRILIICGTLNDNRSRSSHIIRLVNKQLVNIDICVTLVKNRIRKLHFVLVHIKNMKFFQDFDKMWRC